MKRLAEYLADNGCPITPKQELLIVQWLDECGDRMTGGNLADGMRRQIQDRLLTKYINEVIAS